MSSDKLFFVARLTQNRAYSDLKHSGDRTLAIWLNNNSWLFNTYDGQKNIAKFVNHTENIENIWYFV